MAQNPEIILFDEPTSALDPLLSLEIFEAIKTFVKGKVSMIIVTHDFSFAKVISDRIVYMEDGQIIEEQPKDMLLSNPQKSETKKFLKHYL